MESKNSLNQNDQSQNVMEKKKSNNDEDLSKFDYQDEKPQTAKV